MFEDIINNEDIPKYFNIKKQHIDIIIDNNNIRKNLDIILKLPKYSYITLNTEFKKKLLCDINYKIPDNIIKINNLSKHLSIDLNDLFKQFTFYNNKSKKMSSLSKKKI
jgi:hypothetical protein